MAVKTDDSVVSASVSSATAQNGPALLKEYKGEITLRLSELPALKPRVLPTRSSSPWRRFIEAGQRRTFTLSKNFYIEVEGDALPSGLEGRIVIPPQGNTASAERGEDTFVGNHDPEPSSDREDNVFDGASIPFPWLVSYFSFGVLRPLGILLSASVVHDFAFQFGYLPIIKNGKCKHVPVQRHEADELFRLITQTLNGSNFFSRLAWHSVRLGWWAIKYAGQRFTGEPPVRSTVLALASITVAGAVGFFIRKTWLAELQGAIVIATALIGIIGIAVGMAYIWITIENHFLLPKYYNSADDTTGVFDEEPVGRNETKKQSTDDYLPTQFTASVFVSKGSREEANELFQAVTALVSTLGYSVESGQVEQTNSWIGKAASTLKSFVGADEVSDRIQIMEDMLYGTASIKADAQISKEIITTIDTLERSVGNAVVDMGCFIVVKIKDDNGDSSILAKRLTVNDRQILNHAPEILMSPTNVLKQLSAAKKIKRKRIQEFQESRKKLSVSKPSSSPRSV